jgi:thiosulfate dehydrogenase [quinone] large subunit
MFTLRRFAMPLAFAAAATLIYMINPWFAPPPEIGGLLTVGFWILAIVLVIALFEDRKAAGATTVDVEGPEVTRFLFGNTRAGLLWLPIRLFVGFAFLEAGLHKLFPAGKAIGAGWLDGGASLLGYWTNAVAIPEAPGRAAITFEWYRDFLNVLVNNDAQTWFAYLIVFGEIAIGVGLIFGIFTGFAAFFGAMMNMSFLLAGSASTNPILFTLGVGLILAWRVSGYYGVDRYLLPRVGVPWPKRVSPRLGEPVAAPAAI